MIMSIVKEPDSKYNQYESKLSITQTIGRSYKYQQISNIKKEKMSIYLHASNL